MAHLITWGGRGGISFFVKSKEIRGVKDITIKTSAETEDKTKDGEKYASRKNSGSYNVTLTAVLNAALGVKVQSIAMQMTEAARCGDAGYLYTAGEKLFPSSFMATDATINNIRMNGKGRWTYCEVQWTLKQCTKYDGTDIATKSSSHKKSGRGKSPSPANPANIRTWDIWDRNSGMETPKQKAENAVGTMLKAEKASQNAYNHLTSNQSNKGTSAAASTSRNCQITTKLITRVPTVQKLQPAPI